MSLEGMLLDVDQVKEGRIRDKIGRPYKKYQDAVERICLINWIKEEIENKPERKIVVKISDMAKELGNEFEKHKYGTLYQGLRYVLFYNGFMVSTGTHRDGDKVFVIREKKEGDRLAPSYRSLEKRADRIRERKEERRKIREDVNKEIEEKKLSDLEDKRQKMIKTREEMLQEISRQREELRVEKFKLEEIRKEKEDTEKLRQILVEKFGKTVYMIEIFQFNWKTLAWKLIKRKSIKNHVDLIDLIIGYTSEVEDRYRFEITPVYEIKEEEKKAEEESVEIKEEKKEEIKEEKKEEIKEEKKEEIKEEKKEEIKEVGQQIECPRCGSKNIKTWSTVQIIRTRSGERKLRHRCADCNETFGDEDLITPPEIKEVEE